jgi:hypothetical protein
MNIPRYKIIVQGTIGQLRDQGIRIASRCLWDVSTDNYTSVSYTNVRQSIFNPLLSSHSPSISVSKLSFVVS